MSVSGDRGTGWLVDDLDAMERRLRREFGAPGPKRGIRLWKLWVEENRRLEALVAGAARARTAAPSGEEDSPVVVGLAHAREHASLLPRMDHRRGLARMLADWVVRTVGFVLKPWLEPQRKVNRSLGGAVNEIAETLRLLEERMATSEQRWLGTDATHADLVRQQHLVQLGMALAWQSTSVSNGATARWRRLDSAGDKGAESLDTGYGALQESFRGPRELIEERLREHLPRVRRAVAGVDGGTVLDLGCGRGEWLEILHESGVSAVGVDREEPSLELCRCAGLAVARGDVFDYLASRDDRSFAAVTAFHVVEHLSFAQAKTLLSEIHRVLVPGGLMLLETPNPECLPAISVGFRLDPTHQRPFPSPLLVSLAEELGFDSVGVDLLTTARDVEPIGLASPAGVDAAEWQRLLHTVNKNLLSAPDYALYGFKQSTS